MFKEPIIQFSRNLRALQNFVELVRPAVLNEVHVAARRHIPRFAAVVLANAARPDAPPMADEVKEAWQALAEGDFSKVSQVQLAFRTQPELPAGTDVIKVSPQDARAFEEARDQIGAAQAQVNRLYQSALVSLISAVEVYMSQLFHTYFSKFPDAQGIGDKTLTLKDLRTFPSIEEAAASLVDAKVEGILRGNLDTWFTALEGDPYKLSLGYLKSYRDRLNEIYLRRNLIVHNDGVVNSNYLSRVAKDIKKDIKKGDRLPVEHDYLQEAIDICEHCFILVGADLWKKIQVDDPEREELVDIALDCLTSERWQVAEALSLFTMNDKGLPERTRAVGQVNYWQSLKWQGRFDEIKRDVEKVDYSARPGDFWLAKYALLDQEEEFFKALETVLCEEAEWVLGKITWKVLREWPLYRKMRETESYQRFCDQYQAQLPQELPPPTATEKQEAAHGEKSSSPKPSKSAPPKAQRNKHRGKRRR